MPRKYYNLFLELEIISITSPGVWLCSNGYVALIVETLGIKNITKKVPPIFPLMFHQVFFYKKKIEEANNLQNFIALLQKENISCELVQWSSCCEGRTILAKYEGYLGDLLYISSTFSNLSVDLLMEASSKFPGIIAPKIEIRTKMNIDETIEQMLNPEHCLTLASSLSNFIKKDRGVYPERQKTVCHSNRLNFNQKLKKHIPNISDEYEINNPIASDIYEDHKWLRCKVCSQYYETFKSTPDDFQVLKFPNINERSCTTCSFNLHRIKNNHDWMLRKYDNFKFHCLCKEHMQ